MIFWLAQESCNWGQGGGHGGGVLVSLTGGQKLPEFAAENQGRRQCVVDAMTLNAVFGGQPPPRCTFGFCLRMAEAKEEEEEEECDVNMAEANGGDANDGAEFRLGPFDLKSCR